MKVNFNDERIENKSKYKFDIKSIYNKGEGTIGKGEYLLPLLFNDVYKEPVFTKGSKGDNYILNGENKYYLELKSPVSSPYQNFKNPDVKDIEGLKNEITPSWLFLFFIYSCNGTGSLITLPAADDA